MTECTIDSVCCVDVFHENLVGDYGLTRRLAFERVPSVEFHDQPERSLVRAIRISRVLLNVLCIAVSLVCQTSLAKGVEINPPLAPNTELVTAIIGGRLIRVERNEIIDDATIVVRGNKIVASGHRQEITIPDNARTVDAKGLSILPGLIDSHFHSKNDVRTPVEYELNRGVTSFRDPGHPLRYYDEVLSTKEPMPRVFLCGAHLDAAPPVWPDQAIVIRDAEHARQSGHSLWLGYLNSFEDEIEMAEAALRAASGHPNPD